MLFCNNFQWAILTTTHPFIFLEPPPVQVLHKVVDLAELGYDGVVLEPIKLLESQKVLQKLVFCRLILLGLRNTVKSGKSSEMC